MSRQSKSALSRSLSSEPESLAEVVGDGIRMARHWPVRHAPSLAPRTPWSHIHGVHVSDHSAHLLDGMSDYGESTTRS